MALQNDWKREMDGFIGRLHTLTYTSTVGDVFAVAFLFDEFFIFWVILRAVLRVLHARYGVLGSPACRQCHIAQLQRATLLS